LINDVDGLGRHPELRHEGIKRHDLFLLQAGLRDQVVKLNTEHDLAIGAKLRGKLLGHRREILLLVKRLAEELAQLGVNCFRIIVTKEPETGVDLLLEQDAVCLRKTGQHLDEEGQKIWPLRDAARLAQSPPHPSPAPPLDAIGKRGDLLDRAVNFVCDFVQGCHLKGRAKLPHARSNAIGAGTASMETARPRAVGWQRRSFPTAWGQAVSKADPTSEVGD
jgi:hypothetical protein